MDFKTLHLNRNMFNEVPDDLSVVKDTWTKAPTIDNMFHMNSGSGQPDNDHLYNDKYLHINSDGSSYEAIICSPPNRESYLLRIK